MAESSAINSRQRVLAAICHQPIDRVPIDIWAVPEVWRQLGEYFKTDDRTCIKRHLRIDGFASIEPRYVGPTPPEAPSGESTDYWGIGTKPIRYDTGVYDEQSFWPLAAAETIDDLDAYAWPRAEWFDYGQIRQAALDARRTHAVKVGYHAPLTYHIYLRGLEAALTDPLLKPDFAHHLLRRLCQWFYGHHKRIFEAADGLIDIVEVTDDYGSQNGPLISPAVFRGFYKPHQARICQLARQHGIKVFHHDDGAIRDFIPDLIEIGVDILNPIQWRCPGMEVEDLKKDFGRQLCFHGGIDNQQTLPFGSPAAVRAEVRHMIDTLAGDRTGYIIAPCHNIQAITPLENILAMYDEASSYGRFR